MSLFLFVTLLVFFICYARSFFILSNKYQKSDHFNGKVFHNLGSEFKSKSWYEFFKWRIKSAKIYANISANTDSYGKNVRKLLNLIKALIKLSFDELKEFFIEIKDLYVESKSVKEFTSSFFSFITLKLKKINVSGFLRHVINIVKISIDSIFNFFFKFDCIENRFEDFPPRRLHEDAFRASFIGHSTFLMQFKNLNVITDPIFSERASPFSFIGPKRYRKPAIKFRNLPEIDVVLITHNHYDHMDIPTIKSIYYRDNPIFLVPLGNAWIIKNHIKNANVIELDWWESVSLKGFKFHLIEAKHWSSRFIFDENKSLWGGFVIDNDEKQVCITCDTGYDKRIFDEISNRFKNIVLSTIPIGAYEPKWLLSDSHINPEEAVMLHLDIKSKKTLASHFGTFKLADESFEKQCEDLEIAKNKYNVGDEFEILEFGKSVKGDF